MISRMLGCGFFLLMLSVAGAQQIPARKIESLNGAGWQFVGAADSATLPEAGSDAFRQGAWSNVTVPHNFQTRAAYDTLTKGWYRRQITINPAANGKEFYLVFEGAASIADVYVNGQHLGQHRGAYTRFVFDATKALHPGSDNELAVAVNDSPADTTDCLPWSGVGLYKVWGGLYRNVWLVTTAPVHIDPTDAGAPGMYPTPANVSKESAGLNVRVLLRNTSTSDTRAEVRARIFDPDGREFQTLASPVLLSANGRAVVELNTTIDHPQLWESLRGFTVAKLMSVYIMATNLDQPPAFAAAGLFKPVTSAASLWRDNAEQLVPAQLYVHEASVGEKLDLSLGDRDAAVLFKTR